MNKKQKLVVILVISVIISIIVFFASSSYLIYRNLSELPVFNPHLKTAAVSFIDDFCYSDKAHYRIIDVDKYGRILYFCNYNKADFVCPDGDHVYGFIQIVQVNNGDQIGCYEYVSYIKFNAVYESSWVPGEEMLQSIKSDNDWNMPLNEEKIKYVDYVDKINYYDLHGVQ